MRDQATRLSGRERHRLEATGDLFVIVPVDLAHCPSEAAPFIDERLQSQRVFDPCEALELVVVDDRD